MKNLSGTQDYLGAHLVPGFFAGFGQSTFYTSAFQTTAAVAKAAGAIHWNYVFIPRRTTIRRLGVATAAGAAHTATKARIGLYRYLPDSLHPILLTDEFDLPAATADVGVDVYVEVEPGTYFIGVEANGVANLVCDTIGVGMQIVTRAAQGVSVSSTNTAHYSYRISHPYGPFPSGILTYLDQSIEAPPHVWYQTERIG